MALMLREVVHPDIRRARRMARRMFREQYPLERIAKVQLRAEEEDRYVVWLWYGDTIPPRYKFYAISKATGDVALIEDNEAYRPKRKSAR